MKPLHLELELERPRLPVSEGPSTVADGATCPTCGEFWPGVVALMADVCQACPTDD